MYGKKITIKSSEKVDFHIKTAYHQSHTVQVQTVQRIRTTGLLNERFCLGSAFRTTTPGETKLLASEIYEILQASGTEELDPTEPPVSSRRKAQFFLGSSNKRAKTVVLQIDGLDDPVRPDKF